MTAYRIEVLTDSRVADEDLSAKQFFAVSPTSTGVDLSDLAGENVVGILGLLQNKPASGIEAEVGMLGIYGGKLGGTVDLMEQLTTDASGELVRARPGDWVLGLALQAGVDGDEIPVFVCPKYPEHLHLTASLSMATHAGYAVSMHTVANQMDLAGNGESAVGILLANTANAAIGKVQTHGYVQAVAGTGGISAGDLLGCEAGGKVVAAATGDHVIGLAPEAIAADATGTIFFDPRGTVA